MAKTRVLFVCTGNSARSQMAEALLRDLAPDRFEVFSAGTRPAGINVNAVRALAEIGIDISGQRSKSVDDFAGQHFDCVVTVCDGAREACPVFPGAALRVHQSFADPAAAPPAAQLEVCRRVRDEIRSWLPSLLAAMPEA